MKKAILILVAVVSCLCTCEDSLYAQLLELSNIFSDNMVLQRGVEIPIWGSSNPLDCISIKINGQAKSAIADSAGNWMVRLDPMKAGGPFTLKVSGKSSREFNNVMIGDVWLCSGQSNMELNVARALNASQEMAAAHYPDIRTFTVARKTSDIPLTNISGIWRTATSAVAIRSFSAVGYFFGRDLYEEFGIPIGLIASAWGGTPAEAWTPMQTLKLNAGLQPILYRYKEICANYATNRIKYPKTMQRYEKKFLHWLKTNKQGPRPLKPKKIFGPNDEHAPSSLFNGMIYPLIPFAIKGVIWYQGEANAHRAYEYRRLLPAMISGWRNYWKQGAFPFLIVQLANYTKPCNYPCNSSWAELREAQLMTVQNVPNCALAVAIDLGEAHDIHPMNKQDVGKRLALCARRIAYGQNIVYSGPIYESMIAEGDKIRLKFQDVDGGLVAHNGELRQFAIAGKDKKFVWANARIEGKTIIVWNDRVKDPAAVRYAWANNPAGCNLYNKAGLPATPFRTDSWKGITEDKK